MGVVGFSIDGEVYLERGGRAGTIKTGDGSVAGGCKAYKTSASGIGVTDHIMSGSGINKEQGGWDVAREGNA